MSASGAVMSGWTSMVYSASACLAALNAASSLLVQVRDLGLPAVASYRGINFGAKPLSEGR